MSGFIKNQIIRQGLFIIKAQELAIINNGRTVVTAWLTIFTHRCCTRQADDSDQIRAFGRHFIQGIQAICDKIIMQQPIATTIATDCQFRKDDDIGAVLLGLFNGT